MRGLDDNDKGNSSDTEKDGFDKSGIANYVPNQRLEWKRYKQYTRNDIMSAIEEVKQGTIHAMTSSWWVLILTAAYLLPFEGWGTY